jgi:sialic acid synthase SpsE
MDVTRPVGRPPYIIAEMASSHEGDPLLARTIIDGAGAAGADAVQFQIWAADQIVVPHHPDMETLRRIEISYDEWGSLAEYSRGRYPSMDIIGCVYEPRSAEFCQRIGVDAYKLHSADLSNPILVRHVAATGKRIDLSVGASTLDEIQTAIAWIAEVSESPIWLMYGLQNFPTPPEAVRLRYMMKLHELFELPIGYQDHTDAESEAAYWLPCAALGMGVAILEKHITHDRFLMGIDHQAALNPDEFLRFAEMARTVSSATGAGRPRPFSEGELQYRQYSKKSLVASRDVSEGETITAGDLAFMRADELGLPPDQAQRLVGRSARRAIAAHELVREEDVS